MTVKIHICIPDHRVVDAAVAVLKFIESDKEWSRLHSSRKKALQVEAGGYTFAVWRTKGNVIHVGTPIK